jgi:hypothetical protein
MDRLIGPNFVGRHFFPASELALAMLTEIPLVRERFFRQLPTYHATSLFYMVCCLTGGASGLIAAEPQFVWQGDVDGSAVLQLHGKRLKVEVRQGAPIGNPSYHFTAPLPDSRLPVRLQVLEGRGRVEITERPNLENDYRLTVLIEDLQEGSSHYSIALYWNTGRGSYRESEGPEKFPIPDVKRLATRRGLRWSARVQGRVRVAVEQSKAEVEPYAGARAEDVQAAFDRPLTAQPDRTIAIYKRHGRGEVRIVEYPAKSNGYRLVFEVADPGEGDLYSVDVNW